MSRVLGIVSSEQKADDVVAKITSKFPSAKVEREPADSTPGRVRLVLKTNVLSLGGSAVEAMERIVDSGR